MPRKHCGDSSCRLQFTLNNLEIPSHGLQPIALAEEQRHQTEHGKPGEEKHLVHRRIKPRARCAHNDWLWVLRAPPTDRTEDERHIDECEYAKKRTKERAPIGLFDQRPQE